jgi:protein Mpv17
LISQVFDFTCNFLAIEHLLKFGVMWICPLILFKRPSVGNVALQAMLKKTACNQLFMAPIMNTLFYGYVQLLSRHREDSRPWLQRWKSKLEKEFFQTTAMSLTIWTPLQMINFYFIPPQYRVLYVSTGLTAWLSFLSFIGHRKHHRD